MSAQVATQELRKVESNINFESQAFAIPDLTESEIETFFANKSEVEIQQLLPFGEPVQYDNSTRHSIAEDKAACVHRDMGYP